MRYLVPYSIKNSQSLSFECNRTVRYYIRYEYSEYSIYSFVCVVWCLIGPEID